MKDAYNNKLITAQEAAKTIQSGERVYVGTANSFAYELMDALWERRKELKDVTILCSMSLKKSKMFFSRCEEDDPFHIETYFLGAGERVAMKNGMPLEFTSLHLSQVDLWSQKIARPDVCFFEVSRPDENGNMSYGATGGAMHHYLKECASRIYVEANLQTPYIVGNRATIHISEVDGIVETDNPISEVVDGDVDETSKKISDILIDYIPDGATIQLGIGKVSTAVGFALQEKNDLGIFSELFSEPMYRLMKNGNVTNRQKGFMDGISVFGFSMGSKEMYDYMNYNPKLYSSAFPFINDPRNIAKNKRMISINTAMSVNLFGEVAADSMGWHQQSAVGGQIDYVKGSQWSEGGKSIIALASSFEKNGELKSKICLHFPEGTAITTPRSEVQYLATEYGCVNLKELNMSDRVRAMIQLAHPKFRDELAEQAKERHLI